MKNRKEWFRRDQKPPSKAGSPECLQTQAYGPRTASRCCGTIGDVENLGLLPVPQNWLADLNG